MKTNSIKKIAGIIFLALFFTVSLSFAQVITPGSDGFVTPGGGGTFVTIPPLPAGFFGPGSDPFTGMVTLQGSPLSTIPAGILGSQDAIVKRMTAVGMLPCPSNGTVPIEIVALSLVSSSPITVTYGGINPEPWVVRVYLSEFTPQTPGTMTLTKSSVDGGTFNSSLPVTPRFVFTNAGHPTVVLDPNGGLPPITLTGINSCWVFGCPTCATIAIPPGVLVDADGNGTINVSVPPSTNFFPAISSNGTCAAPGTYSFCTIVEQHPVGAQHTVISPLAAQTQSPIPTLSQWGLIIFGLLMILVTLRFIRRRQIKI